MSQSIDELKDMIVRAAEMLFKAEVMQHGGHGNLSARLIGDQMVITSGGNIRGLTTADLAVVAFDGQIISGRMEPTNAEIVSMHAAVYRTKSDVGAIIHTHSPHVTAFALAHQPLPVAYEGLLRFGTQEPIPVAEWAPRGSDESVGNIVEQIKQHPTAPAVLLANHGLLAFSSDPLRTAQLIVSMEEAAEFTLRARDLGGEKAFPAGAAEKEQERMRQFQARR